MGLFKTYQTLSPTRRLGLGLAVLAWGAVGLYLSDATETALGLAPSEHDRETLRRMTPRIVAVERGADSGGGGGGRGTDAK